MTKILFVCHGNICRSPAAELVLKELLRRAGAEDEFLVASAATSSEEIGNSVYPPMRRVLEAHGISCPLREARRIRRGDYADFDLLIGMDGENLTDMRRLFGGDPDGKLRCLMDYAGRPGEAVADPWYTRDFERTWEDVYAACRGLLYELTGVVAVDFSGCRRVHELYAELRESLGFAPWYGNNLDALHDVLTGLPHRGSRFLLTMPPADAPEDVRLYAERIAQVFRDAELA